MLQLIEETGDEKQAEGNRLLPHYPERGGSGEFAASRGRLHPLSRSYAHFLEFRIATGGAFRMRLFFWNDTNQRTLATRS
jgi:hypothetical protein